MLRSSGRSLAGIAKAREPALLRGSSPLNSIFAIVPEHEPIELVAYDPECPADCSEHELQTKRWLVENVREGWTIFDVGAEIGVYSILLSRLASQGSIYAFEPTDTIHLLRRNLDHHHADNVRTLRIELGAPTAPIDRDVEQAPEELTGSSATIDTMRTLLKLDRVDCIKIDVESAAFKVLRGAEQTLAQLNPWIVVTLDHALQRDQAELLEWLSARGYSSARMLDYQILVLRRDAGADSAVFQSPQFNLAFEQRPVMLREGACKGTPLADYFAGPVLHGASSVATSDSCEPDAISVPGPRWTYAASWAKSASANFQGPLVIDVEITSMGGAIGLGCVSPAMDAYLSSEVFVPAGASRQNITLNVPDNTAVGHLILRNADADGRSACVQVHRIGAFRGRPVSQRPVSPLLDANKRRLSLAECEASLSGIEPSPSSASIAEPGIEIVPVEELGAALGFCAPFVTERKVYSGGLAAFQTEKDEAAIYAYLYRNTRPRRHLEFGTWEGFGVTLCARVCDAEIWTINLPEGESDTEGNPVYGSTPDAPAVQPAHSTKSVRGDSGDRIGWRYREAGFGSRVHQILCDSRDFEAAQFAPGSFDTILIDGSHHPEIVANDTNKALPLLRKGGIMIWHDFCPEVETIRRREAPRGVVRAVVDNWAKWSWCFSKMMWVRPSWILLGIRG